MMDLRKDGNEPPGLLNSNMFIYIGPTLLLVTDTGPGRGMRYDEVPILKICE